MTPLFEVIGITLQDKRPAAQIGQAFALGGQRRVCHIHRRCML